MTVEMTVENILFGRMMMMKKKKNKKGKKLTTISNQEQSMGFKVYYHWKAGE